MANANSIANGAKTRFRSGDEAAKAGKKGGKASGEVRKEWKTFKECFQDKMTSKDREQLYNMLLSRAKAGNLKAYEILRDSLGEKPADEVTVTDTTDLSVTIEVID